MSTLEEIKAHSEGLTDLCEGYMAQGIRHLLRNCEVLCPTHEEDETSPCNRPGMYAGDRMAAALRDHAKLVAALEAVGAKLEENASQLRETADRLNQQVMDRDPDRDVDAARRYSSYASSWEAAQRMVRLVVGSRTANGAPRRRGGPRMSKPLTMTEVLSAHKFSNQLGFCTCGGWNVFEDGKVSHNSHIAAAILAAGYGSIAEAAHKARRETLAEVQAHVRTGLEMVQPGGREPKVAWRVSPAVPLAKVDGYLSNLQIAHARQDPAGRALAEGILERKAAEQ